MARPSASAKAPPAGKPATTRPARTPYPPTSDYVVRRMEGWTVRVHKELLNPGPHKADGDKALKLLSVKLYDITRTVPAEAVEKLRKIPIWISAYDRQKRTPCACYHPSASWLRANGYNPDKARCVDILSARTFYDWATRAQPGMVLHELAHGYHHQFLGGGFGDKELRAAYDRMKASKTYESVLYFNGSSKRAYALNNPQEYFAESTEALFGANDFYPFVRAELRKHDPKMYELLRKLWKIGGR